MTQVEDTSGWLARRLAPMSPTKEFALAILWIVWIGNTGLNVATIMNQPIPESIHVWLTTNVWALSVISNWDLSANDATTKDQKAA